ncbi:MAG: hypothetical protein BMS9Abin28_2448 [Anaerolineae bacterium]|nr:MAG: hypothetical protein BMS9Abin28_2448 [Anaerolineae bacterium]
MSYESLIKISGSSSIGAGVVIILTRVSQVALFGDLPLSVHGADPRFLPMVGIPGLIGSILFLLGLIGLYAVQASQAGKFGLVAFLFAFFGMSLALGANWAYAFGSPYLATTAPALLDADFDSLEWGVFGVGFLYSYLIGGVGYMVFAVSTILARVVPAWIGLAMLLSMLLAAILPVGTVGAPSILLNVLMGIGPILFGIWLWRAGSLVPRVQDVGAA